MRRIRKTDWHQQQLGIPAKLDIVVWPLSVNFLAFCRRNRGPRSGEKGSLRKAVPRFVDVQQTERDDILLYEIVGVWLGLGAMILARYLEYGTSAYPESVARRLRATNITALFVAGTMMLFIAATGAPHPVTVLVVLGILAVPLLHRFGSAFGPIALVLFVWVHVVRAILTIGTGDGIYLAFLSAAPLCILLLGVEQLWLAGILSALSVTIAATLNFSMPSTTGVIPGDAMRLQFALNLVLNGAVLFGVVAYVANIAARAEAAAKREHTRSEKLLANILPQKVAARLKDEEIIADRYEAASVLFADMAGFTARASDTEPEELVRFLDDVFTRIDGLVETHGLEKIKTTGDAYMVVSGVPNPRPDHAEALADLALAMREALADLTDPKGRAVPVRIGIATGPVVAGVVGKSKFFYDVWGDTVNVAARMEQTGEPGQIQVAADMARLFEGRYQLTERAPIEVHGKGRMQTWYLVQKKADNAASQR